MISPDNPLLVAARDVDSYIEEYGLARTLDWLGLPVAEEELFYFARQRALRAAAVNLGYRLPLDEQRARKLIGTDFWARAQPALIASSVDGIAIGWRGGAGSK